LYSKEQRRTLIQSWQRFVLSFLTVKAGRITIAEVEELVEVGTLKPEEIHVAGIYVKRIIQGKKYEKRIERLTLTSNEGVKSPDTASDAALRREKIVRRAAKEFKDGMNVNLGIGMPMLASNYLEKGVSVLLQSENGYTSYPNHKASSASAHSPQKRKSIPT
jgi:3-oxoacid CoA-transferase